MLTPIQLSQWSLRPIPAEGIPANVKRAFLKGGLPAQVPGNVHDDLLAHDLIPDPYLGQNERLVQWIGRQDWRYTAQLPPTPTGYERIDLVADGLDTSAELRIDGAVLGQVCNQHRTYRFDVTSQLAAAVQPSTVAKGDTTAGSELVIDFESIYKTADRVKTAVGDYPAAYEEPFAYVRKMAANFGWDWGPTLATAGIWRSIRLEAWNTARIAALRPYAYLDTPTGSSGQLQLDLEVECTRPGTKLRVEAVLVDPAGQPVAQIAQEVEEDKTRLSVAVGPVERWWPCDMGQQPLYQLEVTLIGPEGPLDTTRKRLGFRHIELVTQPDAVGESFGFTVAGQPVFTRGYNWIPDDLLVTRVTKDQYRSRLAAAVESGANLVRIWGGGIYEDDAFYEVCDELGLMVWQDCLFACAAYPETAEFAAEVEAETRDNVTRLMSHPSLVLWNGCNENLWGFKEWGWEPVLEGKGWGKLYYFDILPRVIKDLDPGRPYWPGSPYSGRPDRDPNHPDYGCNHSWVVWNQTDYFDYASDQPRFVAEFGWCGAAAYSTTLEAVGEEHLRPWDPVLMWHYKPIDGEPKLKRALSAAFHEPKSFDGWHYVTQVRQARAVGFGLDYWRGLWPHCQGALVWQLNDCWPVMSWAAVDSAGHRKPVWYAVQRSFADRLAAVQDSPDGYVLRLVNNSAAPWTTTPLVRRLEVNSGTERARWAEPLVVPPGTVLSLLLPRELAPEPGTQTAVGRGLAADELLVVDQDALVPDPFLRRVVAQPDRVLHLEQPSYRLETKVVPGGFQLQVTAFSVVRDLLLQPDRIAAQGEAKLVTLLPGETYEWFLAPDPAAASRGQGALNVAGIAPPVLLDAASVELAARQQPE